MRRRGGGRINRIAVGVMMRVIANGPMNQGANFGLVVRSGMSLDDSHTFCPTTYLGAGRREGCFRSQGGLWVGKTIMTGYTLCNLANTFYPKRLTVD